jgi:hypothetical protein
MKIVKDGDYIIVPVPQRDLQAMARFIAHSIVAIKRISLMKLSHEIVSGDLSKQDEYVQTIHSNSWD